MLMASVQHADVEKMWRHYIMHCRESKIGETIEMECKKNEFKKCNIENSTE